MVRVAFGSCVLGCYIGVAFRPLNDSQSKEIPSPFR